MTAVEALIDKHLTHRNKADHDCRHQLIASITELVQAGWEDGYTTGFADQRKTTEAP